MFKKQEQTDCLFPEVTASGVQVSGHLYHIEDKGELHLESRHFSLFSEFS
jgi:hypothetical protein